MIKKIKKLNQLQKLVIISTLVGIGLILLSIPSIFLNQPGWTIGIAIGVCLEVPSVALLFIGSDLALRKGSSISFLLSYGLRFILIAAGLIFTCLMYYTFDFEAFKYSVFGVLIGYTPMQFVVTIVMLKEKHDDNSLVNKNNIDISTYCSNIIEPVNLINKEEDMYKVNIINDNNQEGVNKNE